MSARIETETRVAASDAGARRRFACHSRVVGLGGARIRRGMLRAIRPRAEAA